MNFKIFPFLLFFLSCILITYAQTVNLSNKEFNVNYVGLPSNPILEDSNRTYNIISLNSEVLTQSFPTYYFEREIVIPGFSKLVENGFLNIKSTLVDVNLLSSEIERKTSVSKDKDGNEVKTTLYQAIIKYNTEGSVEINAIDGSISKTLSFSEEKEKSSRRFSTWKAADNFRRKNRIKTLRIEFVKEVIENVNNTLAKLHGYRNIKTKQTLSILKSKKHPEMEPQMENYELLKTAFDKMTYDQPLDDLKSEIAPALTYFKGIIEKYPGDDRKSKKIKKAALYNLATLYYFIDEPDTSIMYADKMFQNDKGKGEAKSIKKQAEGLKTLFKDNEVNTRHFSIVTEDNTDYQVNQDQNNAIGTEEPLISEDPDYSLSYVMTLNGDTIPSYVNITRIKYLSNILNTFVKDMEGKFIERNFNADEVELLVLGNGEKLRTVPFKGAADMPTLKGSPSGRKFVKQIFNTNDLKLYRYQTEELVIKKKGEKLGYSTSSASWVLGFKKKLASLAKNVCPSLAERALNKEFTNNADSLMEFMRAYKECTNQ